MKYLFLYFCYTIFCNYKKRLIFSKNSLYNRFNKIDIFIFSLTIIAETYIVWSSTKNLYISLIALCVSGVFKSLKRIYSTTIIQQEIPREYVGRIFSLNKIILTASAMIGVSLSPVLYNLIGPDNAFLIFSIIGIFTCLGAMIYIRKFNIEHEKEIKA